VSVCTTTLSSFHVFLGSTFFDPATLPCPQGDRLSAADLQYPDCVQLPACSVSQFPWYTVPVCSLLRSRCLFRCLSVRPSTTNPDCDTVMTLTDLDIERLQELLKFQEQDSSYNLSQFKVWSAHQYIVFFMKVWKNISQGSEVAGLGLRKWTFFLFLIKFGYKAFGFSFNDFPFRQVLNIISTRRAWRTDCSTFWLQFDAVVSVGVLEHVRGNRRQWGWQPARECAYFETRWRCVHLPNQFSLIEFIALCCLINIIINIATLASL